MVVSPSLVLLSVLLIGFSSLVSAQSYCEDYVTCMERLEAKQRECIQLEQNTKHRSTDSCSRRKWDIKLELNGLHMRRVEVARDCIQKNLADASLSETVLDEKDQVSCDALHKKFAFAPRVPARKKRSSALSLRSKRSSSSKKQNKVSECRNAARSWHKQCSSLAKCCPFTEDCKLNTKDIMEQIFAERRKLRDLKEECERF